jgi:hypothetical protein
MKENVKNFKFCHFTQIPEKVKAWKNNILHTSKSVFPNETETRVKNSVDLSGFNIKVPNLLDKVFEKERMIDQEVSDRFFNKRRYVEELIGEVALEEQLSMNLEQEREKRMAYEAEGLGEEDIAYMRQKEREEFLDSLNKPLTKKEKAKLTKKGKFIGLLTGEADNNKIVRSVQKKIAGMEFPDVFNDNKVRQVIDEAVSQERQKIDMRDAPERKRLEDEEVERARLLEKASREGGYSSIGAPSKPKTRAERARDVAGNSESITSTPYPGTVVGPGKGGGVVAQSVDASISGMSVPVPADTSKAVVNLVRKQGVRGEDLIPVSTTSTRADDARFAKNATPEQIARGKDLIERTRKNSTALQSASGATVQAQAISNELSNYRLKTGIKPGDKSGDEEMISAIRGEYGFEPAEIENVINEEGASAGAGAGAPVPGKKKNVPSDEDVATKLEGKLNSMDFSVFKNRYNEIDGKLKKYKNLVDNFDKSKVNEEKLVKLFNEATTLQYKFLKVSASEKNKTKARDFEKNLFKQANALLDSAAKNFGFTYPGIVKEFYKGQKGQTKKDKDRVTEIESDKKARLAKIKSEEERKEKIKKELTAVKDNISSVKVSKTETSVNVKTIKDRFKTAKGLGDESLIEEVKKLAREYAKVLKQRIRNKNKEIKTTTGEAKKDKLNNQKTGAETDLASVNAMIAPRPPPRAPSRAGAGAGAGGNVSAPKSKVKRKGRRGRK